MTSVDGLSRSRPSCHPSSAQSWPCETSCGGSRIQLGHCVVDLAARRVTCDGQIVELTAKEFDLLAYLAARPGHVFDREQLLNAVWRSASEWQQLTTVTEHVRRLRKKIEIDAGTPTIVVTVRGAGYRLDLPPAGDIPGALTAPPPAVSDAPAHLRDLLTGVLADVADAVIITDLHSHIRSWNPAAERVYGWPADVVLGRHLLDVLEWVDDGGQLAAVWEELRGTGRWRGTVLQVTSDGSTVEILSSKTLLRARDGEPIGIVCVNRPVEAVGVIETLEPDTGGVARIAHRAAG